MRRAGLALAFVLITAASMVWIPLTFALPVWIGGILLLVAFLVGTTSRGEIRDPSPHRTLLIGGSLVLLIAAWFLDWPLRAAAVLTVVGLVTQGANGLRERASFGARFVGEIGLAQGLTASLYVRFLGNAHVAPWLAPLDRALGRVLGLNVTVSAGQSFFPGPAGVVAVTPTWDHLGLVFGLVALVGWLVWIGGTRAPQSRWRILGAVAVAAGYLILRRFALLLVSIELDRPELFWNPAVTMLSMLPLAGCLAALAPRGRARSGAARVRGTARLLLVCGGSAVAGLLLLLGSVLSPPGPVVSGAVTFDEAHGDWESTLRPMDTEWYGMSSTYNYASLYAWLAHYTAVGQITDEIDADALRGTQVLVLKTPSIPYAPAEIEAIAEFVRSGGGLFVIGDHTNVFGSTTVLNPVLETFGLSFRYDSTYDLLSGSFTASERTGGLLDPIGQHVERLEFLTSCTLAPSWRAVPILTDTRVLANQADYGTRDFFPEERFTHASIFGGATQAAMSTYGRGRVVAFTDSTCFSSFSLHMNGYPDFILATIGLLSRTVPVFPWRCVLLAAGTLVILLAIGLSAASRSIAFRPILLGLLVAWAISSPIGSALHRTWYPLPEPIDDVPYVYFDTAHSQARISAQPTYAEGASSGAYDTFFVSTQRVGLVPRLVDGCAGPLAPSRTFVLIDPAPNLDSSFLGGLAAYVESGGRLVLMGRPGRDDEALETTVVQFGHELARSPAGGWMLEGAEVRAHEVSPALSLRISIAPHGQGILVLVSDSSPFSNLSLGGAFTTPSTVRRALYEVVYRLFAPASAD
jgi:hypothetical protein